jgi:outer membrane biosynthesis protein TonB
MSEERFDQSADMRLVELRREQLGIAKPTAASWQSRTAVDLPFGPAPETVAPESGAVLSLALNANPDSGLIPGAVVTLGLSVINEGAKAATKTSVRLPLPGAMEYRPGSLQIDGREAPDEEAERLFGTGLDLGTLVGAQRRTLLLKLTTKASIDDPVLAPSLSSADAAVVGAKAVRLGRKAAATAFAATVTRAMPAEAPAYELEPEETIAYEAADAALSPIVAPQAAPPPPPPPPPPPAAPVIEPAPPRPATPPPAPKAQPAAPPAVAPKSAPVQVGSRAHAPVQQTTDPTLTTSIEKTKVATLSQFFAATRSFGMVAHYLLLSAVACSRTLPREQADDAIASFFSAQDALLTRALIAKRLGKSVALDDVAAPLPAFPPAFPASAVLPAPGGPDAVVLLRTFKVSELDFIGRAVANTGSPPFTRAGQLSVGLCATTVVAADRSRAEICERALAEYAANASSEINRLFVRARLDKRTDLFGASSPQLDERARAVLAGLSAVV